MPPTSVTRHPRGPTAVSLQSGPTRRIRRRRNTPDPMTVVPDHRPPVPACPRYRTRDSITDRAATMRPSCLVPRQRPARKSRCRRRRSSCSRRNRPVLTTLPRRPSCLRAIRRNGTRGTTISRWISAAKAGGLRRRAATRTPKLRPCKATRPMRHPTPVTASTQARIRPGGRCPMQWGPQHRPIPTIARVGMCRHIRSQAAPPPHQTNTARRIPSRPSMPLRHSTRPDLLETTMPRRRHSRRRTR